MPTPLLHVLAIVPPPPVVDTVGRVGEVDVKVSPASKAASSFTAQAPLLYCTVLYCNVPYCTALYYTVLYCTVLHCTVMHFTPLKRTGLDCAGTVLG